MDEFSSYLKKSFDFKQKREERQKELSKEKLLSAAKKKIQTTMIGSLSSMEKYFGFLWDIDNPTEEQSKLKEFSVNFCINQLLCNFGKCRNQRNCVSINIYGPYACLKQEVFLLKHVRKAK